MVHKNFTQNLRTLLLLYPHTASRQGFQPYIAKVETSSSVYKPQEYNQRRIKQLHVE